VARTTSFRDLPEPTAPGGGGTVGGGGGDERVELRSHGTQADQRQPLLRRQLHQPQPAQPHHRVSALINPQSPSPVFSVSGMALTPRAPFRVANPSGLGPG